MIITFLSNNSETDITKFKFELTADRRPNFTEWEYPNIIKPTWSELEDIQNTENHNNYLSQQVRSNCGVPHTPISIDNSKLLELENKVVNLEKQVSDLSNKVNANAENKSANAETKSLTLLKDVSDKLAKVDAQSKVNIKPKTSLLSRR